MLPALAKIPSIIAGHVTIKTNPSLRAIAWQSPTYRVALPIGDCFVPHNDGL
jgi:hypothetical protein